jgi:hypothetical protein
MVWRAHFMVNKKMAWSLIGLCLSWRLLRWCLDFPVWGDEAMLAINFFDASYTDLFSPLEYGQIGPLGWLWLEKLMFDIGRGNMLLLRLPGFIAGVCGVLLFWKVAKKIVDERAALFALALFCASYYPMRYSIEVKPYAFDLLIALMLINATLDHAPKKFFIIAAGGIFFSLPSMFTAAACGLYLFYKLASQRKLLFLGGVLLISAYAWMATSFAAPHATAASWLREMEMWVTAFPPLQEWWTLPYWLIERHAGYMSAYPSGGRDFGSLATLILQLIGVAVLWRQGRKQQLLILWGGLPFLFIAAAMQAYPYGGSVRVAIFLAPAICICAGAGLQRLLQHRHALPVFASMMAIFIVSGMVADIKQPYKTESDLQVEQFVEQLVADKDRTAVIVGHLPTDTSEKMDLRNYGGGLARLRYLLRRDFGSDASWSNNSSPAITDSAVIHIEYHSHDAVPTFR